MNKVLAAVTFRVALGVVDVEEIQRTPGVLWKARQSTGTSRPLSGVTAEALEARRKFATSYSKTLTSVALPDTFDSETNWPHCAKVIGDIRDQSNCGCCWAFAAAEAASDRLCIATNGTMMVPLSAQDVCFCASSDGCNGGDITSPWEFIKKGVVTGGQYEGTGAFGKGLCSNFAFPHCHHHGPQKNDPFPAEGAPGCPSQSSPQCPRKCDTDAQSPHDDFDHDKIGFDGEILQVSGEENIMQAIMEGGPVETAFTVYADFENYDGGIYHHVTGAQLGGHAVKIVGWGVEGGVKFWKVANSWNPYWAEKGYFRIKRGDNDCGIEDMVTASSPKAKWSAPSRETIVETIQRTPGVLWKARQSTGTSRPLSGVTAEGLEARRKFATSYSKTLTSVALPDTFDSETNWPHCAKVIGDIRDQSNCGCCWAFAAAEAASDRLCIATNGTMMAPLSAQDVCFCASSDGCNGGDITSPWEFIKKGVVTGGQYEGTGPFGKGLCSNFAFPHCHHHGPQKNDPYPAEGAPGCPSQSSPQCPRKCDTDAQSPHDDFDHDKIGFDGEILQVSGEENIMQAIMEGGPVETAFTVYADFANYDGGIYHHVTGAQLGGHAVKIVGWGVEGGVKFWKVANSWNPYWAEKGYFRIKRGDNDCGIEDMVTASSPKATWAGMPASMVV